MTPEERRNAYVLNQIRDAMNQNHESVNKAGQDVNNPDPLLSAENLVATIVAARKAGNKNLEAEARRALRDNHGVEIVFREREGKPAEGTKS